MQNNKPFLVVLVILMFAVVAIRLFHDPDTRDMAEFINSFWR